MKDASKMVAHGGRVEEAVAAERERCAKLIEALGKISSQDVIYNAAKIMAAEIRKQ